jgi:hypothetical protein
MSRSRYVAAMLTFALITFTLQAADISPGVIAADTARSGAKKVVAQLNAGSASRWKAVIAGIASGKDAWLEIARVIEPGVDAGMGEDLTGAAATALRANPVGVLRLVGTEFQEWAGCRMTARRRRSRRTEC